MGYKETMQAAGAKVIAYKTFGDYQGTWLAKVEWNGQIGWVEGFYGSCSGCDAFEAEFGYESRPVVGDEDFWDETKGSYSPATQADVEAYDARFKAFGLRHLERNLATQAEMESEVSNREDYGDDEPAKMLAFVKNA
jgi:hypothetical protein